MADKAYVYTLVENYIKEAKETDDTFTELEEARLRDFLLWVKYTV